MRRIASLLCSGVLAAGGVLGWSSDSCQGGPNLVANGDMHSKPQRATMYKSLTGDGLYWAFDGEAHFGRVVVSGTDNYRPYRDDLRVAYVQAGGQPGRLAYHMLGIDTKEVNTPDKPGSISVWFDLKGRIRPNRTYEYVFQAVVPGKERGEGVPFKVIAPAIWADGEPQGAEFEVKFDGVPKPRTGKVRVGNFERQTGNASLVFVFPDSFKDQLLFGRVVFREVDEALLNNKPAEMPVPVRYIPIADGVEWYISDVLDKSPEVIKKLQDKRGFFAIPGAGGTQEEALIQSTAVVTAALAELGEETDEGPLAKALAWLADEKREPEAEPKSTEVVAWRLYCLARYGDPRKHGKTMARDIEWLRRAQRDDGGWAPVSKEEDEEAARATHSDNETSALVVEALREAHYAGKPTEWRVWRKAAKYWVDAQSRDGGFGAKIEAYGGIGELPTVMRTATGMASLLATLDVAFSAGGRRCDQFRTNQAQINGIGQAWDWLTGNYRKELLLRTTVDVQLQELVAQGQNPFQQAYYLMRSSAVTGRDTLANRNIFLTEAKRILRFYDTGTGTFAGDLRLTGTALLVLSSVNAPTVLQRIIVGGDWASPSKRDAEHLMRYLARARKRTFNWRERSIERPMRELVKVPILYLSIEGPPKWSKKDWAKIREYCFEGGVVLVNIADGSHARDLVEAELAELFPEYTLSNLPPDDPIWSAESTLKLGEPIRVIGNGLKNFVFVPQTDWSCVWQLNRHEAHPEPFEFVNNLLTYTTDGNPIPGTFAESPYDPGATGDRTVPMAHLECGSDVRAYPDFLATMNRLMQANFRVNVEDLADREDSPDVPPHLLWVSNVGEKPLTGEQRSVIRQAIRGGSYVFIEVASGNAGWAEAFRAELRKIDPELVLQPLPALHPIYTGQIRGTQGFDVKRVQVRRALRQKRFYQEEEEEAIDVGRCAMYRLMLGDREVGVFCEEDICSGVSYTQFPGVRGPMPEDARRVAMNVALRAMEQRLGG